MTDYALKANQAELLSESDEESNEVDLLSGLTEDVKAESKADVYWLISIRVLHIMEKKEFKMHKVEYIIGMIHAVFVFLLVLGLQLLITAFLMLAAARIEHEYHEAFEATSKMTLVEATAKMAEAVTNSVQLEAPALTYILPECQTNMQVRYGWIYFVMIFIWASSMLVELKEVMKDLSIFWGMPRTKQGGRMFADDGNTVVSLTPGTRFILLAMGPGVRFVVAVLLIISGAKVLLYRQTMMLVVLCSMSLGFVVGLDDLLFGALSGEKTKGELKGLTFTYTKRVGRLNTYWTGGLNGLVYVALCLLFAFLYVYAYETVVMSFRNQCWAYQQAFGAESNIQPKTDMETFSEMFSTWAKQAFSPFMS